jgi:predicted dienelactone hydrolase
MKIIRLIAGIAALLALFVGAALFFTRPEPLPADSVSSARLEPGPYAVDLVEHVWVDESRTTDSNGDFPGAQNRTFEVALWSPVDAPGTHPLVVYSHGFMSTRHGGTHLAEHLASHGYVVLSANYPLTHFGAPGGPNADDVVHQPADVSFLIDRALALAPQERSFEGDIDHARIGVIGLSLGGLTSTLVAYHPRIRDRRISAAISIAGPSVFFADRFFEFADVPFLMIGGTHDAMIRFDQNAAPIPDKIEKGGLLSIEGASHAGFTYMMSGPLRLLGNPDEIGCQSLMANLDIEAGENPFSGLGGAEDGIIDAAEAALPCEVRFEEAMPAGRQQWLATVAARAFFESQFAHDAADRTAHARFLAEIFPKEIAEVEFTAASG